jgi:antitoxin (DNA-binding transcriptional repressor) of toxin-antitoxin stability system
MVVTIGHAHAFELPPDDQAPADAVLGAVGGEVVYLTRGGQPVAAIVPVEVAAAGEAAVIALEDAADVRSARAALVEGGEPVSIDDLLTRFADDLATYPDAR